MSPSASLRRALARTATVGVILSTAAFTGPTQAAAHSPGSGSGARATDSSPSEVKSVAPAVTIKRLPPAWVLPVSGYHLTGTFGATSSLWSSSHTGLDFAAPTGTPIVSIAAGVVTEAGYDGAYGNKVVVQLTDGTLLWYCHQEAIEVTVGQELAAGEPLGHVGSTGNVTGPHLHLEVRPSPDVPVDPYAALSEHGLHP